MNLPIQAASNLAARRNLTVCILDSDAAQTIATKNTLERSGFPVVAAANPQDALEKIRLGIFHVILIDSILSGTDGISFLGKLLLRNPEMHALLMSADHSVDEAIEAIKHGACDYLGKPLDYSRLVRTLDELAGEIQKPQTSTAPAGAGWRPLPLAEMRRIHIRRVLDTCNGNRVRAARMLGIGRTSLYRFLKSSNKQSTASVVA